MFLFIVWTAAVLGAATSDARAAHTHTGKASHRSIDAHSRLGVCKQVRLLDGDQQRGQLGAEHAAARLLRRHIDGGGGAACVARVAALRGGGRYY